MTNTEKLAAEFQEAVKKQAGSGPRNRYTAALRAQAVEYGRARREEGASEEATARELGISRKALRKWLGEASATADFKRVEVVADEARAARRGSRLVLHGPGGVRVEGLDVESLAELMRRLG
jgi:DNA invertase Pin-like site-specific DNA recombinase